MKYECTRDPNHDSPGDGHCWVCGAPKRIKTLHCLCTWKYCTNLPMYMNGLCFPCNAAHGGKP